MSSDPWLLHSYLGCNMGHTVGGHTAPVTCNTIPTIGMVSTGTGWYHGLLSYCSINMQVQRLLIKFVYYLVQKEIINKKKCHSLPLISFTLEPAYPCSLSLVHAGTSPFALIC